MAKQPELEYPTRTREYHNHHFDSSIWNDLKLRPDDIFITSYCKSGTTWMQQIGRLCDSRRKCRCADHVVCQLIFDGKEGLDLPAISPWIDLRIPPKEVRLAMVDHQENRRFIKSHAPVDGVGIQPEHKYIVLFRDGRDAIWSLYNHMSKGNDAFFAALNDTPGLVGDRLVRPTQGPRQYFLDFFQCNGDFIFPFSFWDYLRSWWAVRHLPNVKIVHYAHLKADLEGEMRSVAKFLDIPVLEERWLTYIEHCSFEYMKDHAVECTPMGGQLFEGGAKTFINKGTNGRWKDQLTPEDIAMYECQAEKELGSELAQFLATGRRES